MKIALIALSVKGGGGQHTEALAVPLSKYADVHLFVPEHYNEDSGNTILHTFETGKTRMKAAKRLLNPRVAKTIWEEIEAIEPDVIHIITGFTFPWCHLWSKYAAKKGIPFIATHHNPEAHPAYFPNNLIEPTLNFFAKRLLLRENVHTHIHVESFISLIEAIGVPNERIHVIRLGSPAGRFEQYRKQPPPARENIVFYFGRLEYYKGIDIIVDVASRFRGQFKFVIAGKGNLPQKLVERIQGDPELFELKDEFIPDAEVVEYLQKAAVAIAPYRQVTQSFYPFIVAAFQTPFVATDLGSFSIDTKLVGGTLIQPDSIEALESGIRSAIGQKTQHPTGVHFEEQVPLYLGMYSRVINTEKSCAAS